MIRLALIYAFVVWLVVPTAAAKSGVEVTLSLERPTVSADKGLSKTGNHTIVAKITNHSLTAIAVPPTYRGDAMRLCGTSAQEYRCHLVLERYTVDEPGMGMGKTVRRAAPKPVAVDAGASRELLRVSVSEALRSPYDSQLKGEPSTPRPRWCWEWSPRKVVPHTSADYSPLQLRSDAPAAEKAVLWFEIEIDGQIYRSVPLVISAADLPR